MITNKIVNFLITITSFVVIPLQLITTFVLGLLAKISFGLLLIPLSIIWGIVFFGPLLGFSYIFEKMILLRPIVAIIGIPLAVIGDTYVALLPSMGELNSRYSKMIICQTFPYSYSYLLFTKNKHSLKSEVILDRIFKEVSKSKPLGEYIQLIRQENALSLD